MIICVTDEIKNNIRNLRKAKGVRGDDLSKLVGKSPSYISRIENGKTATIEDTTLYAIYKNLLGQSDEAVQEYMDMFINQIPVAETLSDDISGLSDIKQTILKDFIACLRGSNNSDLFMKSVVEAIHLSNQSDKDDHTDMFVNALAQIMRTWKQKRMEEQGLYEEMVKMFK